jgi:hypothetical protein
LPAVSAWAKPAADRRSADKTFESWKNRSILQCGDDPYDKPAGPALIFSE